MLDAVWRDLRSNWWQLTVVDSLYKLLALLVLWPVLGLALRFFIALSGRSELADEDILAFLTGPIGWAACVVIGSLWMTILVLQQAALMELLVRRGTADDGVIAALWTTTRRAGGVARLAVLLTARLLLVALPFLLVGGLLYQYFLTEHDINYYLDNRPRQYWWAAGAIGVVLASLVVVLGGLIVRWSYSIPLVLFEELPPREALRQSTTRSAGRRWPIVSWLVRWALANVFLAALAAWCVAIVGQVLIPRFVGRWPLLMLSIGALMAAWTAVHFLLSVLGTSSLATVLLNLYRQVGHTPEALVNRPSLPVATRRRGAWPVVGGLAAVAVACAALGAGAMRGVRLDDDMQITAHRAGAAAAPENTIAAAQQAIQDGADWIEIDVQETSDGEVVVIHDRDLMKIGNSPLAVWNSLSDELRTIDIGTSFDAKFSEARLATLGEMLDAAKHGGIGVVIELKHYGYAQQLEQRVAAIVEQHDMERQIVIMSLDAASLERMAKLRPKWEIGRMAAVPISDLTKQPVDFLAVQKRLATPDFIRRAHASGKQVFAWTVNDAPTMFEMAGRGVDNLITDKPALARAVMDQRENMGPIDRLIVEIAAQFGALPAHIYHKAEL